MKATPNLLIAATLLISMPAKADCFDAAGSYHGVNPWILRAIAYQESRFNPSAVRRNSNGSDDLGATQTNSVHLPELSRYGIQRNHLLDACTSIYVGAWLLKKKIIKHGNTWNAVGAYHSETLVYRDRYAAQVRQIIATWTKAGIIPMSQP